MRNAVSAVTGAVFAIFKMHPNRRNRWAAGRPKVLAPVVDYRIVRDTADRLHAECMGRGLTHYEADNIRGLFKARAQQDGHLQAYRDCTRRAAELVRV